MAFMSDGGPDFNVFIFFHYINKLTSGKPK